MERKRAKARKWKRDNPDKIRQYRARDTERHADGIKARARAWYLANREEALAAQKRYRQENREKILNREHEKRKANPERYRDNLRRHKIAKPASWHLYGVRKTAKAKGVECDLDHKWFEERLMNGVCEMSGRAFSKIPRGRHPDSPSVDRIDPTGPYTKANCRMIIWWLNRAMSNLGEEYAISVFRSVIERRAA